MLINSIRYLVPDMIKKKKLKHLFSITAQAFQTPLPDLNGLSFEECLQKYALFTKERAEISLRNSESVELIKQKLYQSSYLFGKVLRKALFVVTWKQAVFAFKIAYSLIGIDFRYRQGKFQIRQCFFSRYYTPEICMLISAMDEGLASGISKGGKLCFFQRITEGCDCCRGSFGKGNEQ